MVFRRSVDPSGSQKHWKGPKPPMRRLNNRAMVLLNQLQMFSGVLATCFSVIFLLIRDKYDGGGNTQTNGYLFLCIGVLFLLTGMIGICILKSKSTRSVIIYMIFAILSNCFSILGFIIWLYELIDVDRIRNEFANNQDQNLAVFIIYLFTILYGIMIVIFSISVGLCIRSLTTEKDYTGTNSDIVPPPYEKSTTMAMVAESAFAVHKVSLTRENSREVSPNASISRQSTLPRTRVDSYNSQHNTSRDGTLVTGGRHYAHENDTVDSRQGTLRSAGGATGDAVEASNSSTLDRQSEYSTVKRNTIGKKDCTLIFLD